MSERKTIRIFISSPSDVRPERLIAERVVQRLDREFAYHFHVEIVLWEREPLVATRHFQDFENIAPPSTTDIVLVVVWSRLGVPLPAEKFSGAVSGRVPVTGTEWEFEDALRAYQEKGKPDLLLYQKTAPVMITLDDDERLEQQRQQKRLVEDFLTRWFRNNTGTEFTAALHAFSEIAEFEEQLDVHLRALLRKRLEVPGDEFVSSTIRWHESPYRGLKSFDLEHAQIFFGRTRARNELRELLARQAERGCAFVLVMGASGSGKSSLVKAGLLPDLKLPGMVGRVALCRHALVRPSNASGNPLMALAAAMVADEALPELKALRYTAEKLYDQLVANPAQVAFAVEQGLAAASAEGKLTAIAEARLTVIVDQLEELFTLETITPEARRTLVAALEALARSGLVWVIATMRSDFFDRLEMLPELAALSAGEARYLLTPPDSNEIGQIIRQPARQAGLRFEGDGVKGVALDEVLREAAARDTASLPLLEYTLDLLWTKSQDSGVIGFAAYEAVGGMEGAISQQAETVLSGLPENVKAVFPKVLRALVTVGQGTKGLVTARFAYLDQFLEDTPERALVAAFLAEDARLLVADNDDGRERVRIAHEALLTHWPRARDQIAEDRADLQLRARLEQAAALWQAAPAGDRDSLLLHAGLPLSEAEDVLTRRRGELGEDMVRFVEASGMLVRAAERRRVTRLRTVAAMLALLALLAGVGAWFGYQGQVTAEHEAAIARAQEAIAQEQRDEAEKQKIEAERNAQEARRQRVAADDSAAEALLQKNEANRQKAEAEKSAAESQRFLNLVLDVTATSGSPEMRNALVSILRKDGHGLSKVADAFVERSKIFNATFKNLWTKNRDKLSNDAVASFLEAVVLDAQAARKAQSYTEKREIFGVDLDVMKESFRRLNNEEKKEKVIAMLNMLREKGNIFDDLYNLIIIAPDINDSVISMIFDVISTAMVQVKFESIVNAPQSLLIYLDVFEQVASIGAKDAHSKLQAARHALEVTRPTASLDEFHSLALAIYVGAYLRSEGRKELDHSLRSIAQAQGIGIERIIISVSEQLCSEKTKIADKDAIIKDWLSLSRNIIANAAPEWFAKFLATQSCEIGEETTLQHFTEIYLHTAAPQYRIQGNFNAAWHDFLRAGRSLSKNLIIGNKFDVALNVINHVLPKQRIDLKSSEPSVLSDIVYVMYLESAAYGKIKNYEGARLTLEDLVDFLRDSSEHNPAMLSNRLGSLSWYALLTKQFDKAASAAQEAYKINEKHLWVLVNLAHAEMFRGNVSQALALHATHINEQVNDEGDIWRDAALEDIRIFREEGLNSEFLRDVEMFLLGKAGAK